MEKIKIVSRCWLAVIVLLFLPQNAFADELNSEQQAQITAEVMAVLDEFMTHFNRLDVAAWENTFHFPHYRLASGNMNVLPKPSGRSAEQLKNALGAEWHHSAWLHRNIVHLSADKVHVDTRFARFRADNSIIAEYNSLYILTKENGRWGIKMRSSMAP